MYQFNLWRIRQWVSTSEESQTIKQLLILPLYLILS